MQRFLDKNFNQFGFGASKDVDRTATEQIRLWSCQENILQVLEFLKKTELGGAYK